MQLDTNDKHYIEGFEDGCDYIVREIERYAEQHKVYLGDLLYHLKGKDDLYNH